MSLKFLHEGILVSETLTKKCPSGYPDLPKLRTIVNTTFTYCVHAYALPQTSKLSSLATVQLKKSSRMLRAVGKSALDV